MKEQEILLKVLTDKEIIGVISSSILIILFGIYLGRKKLISNKASEILGDLILSVSVPALSFNAFMKDFNKNIFQNSINILIWGFLIHFILIFISKYFYKDLSKENIIPLEMMTIFSGVTVFGIPIVQAIYGDIGIIYASVFSIPYRILIYSYGFMKMSDMKMDRENMNKIFINPVIIATFLGLGIWLFQNYLPQISVGGKDVAILRIDKTAYWLYKPLAYLSSLCSPLAWLAAGLKLSEVSIRKSLKDKISWRYSITKTIFVPLLTIVLVLLTMRMDILEVSDVGIGVMTIMMGTPTASVIIAYALKYNKEPLLASNCSLLSTTLSILTIPFFIIILQLI